MSAGHWSTSHPLPEVRPMAENGLMTTRPAATDLEAIALLEEPTRRRLYDWVIAQPTAVGRDDAASALGITRSLAAFHLDRLVEAGLLDTEFRRLSGRSGPGAGRPAKLYRRSAREIDLSFPARRYGFAAELFARALERADQMADPLADVAHEAGVALGRGGGRGRPSTSKALRVLADNGYEPVADQHGTIRLRNCPFHALSAAHRDLTCGMNLALAQGMVEGMGDVPLRPELDPQPGWCCIVFRPTDSDVDERTTAS
jgi:predicted ArsR family transcriptional regulator